jgi:hypothetical protein
MVPISLMSFVALLLSLVAVVRGDGYGSGISKNTYATSDPHVCYAFFRTYLPVRCQVTPRKQKTLPLYKYLMLFAPLVCKKKGYICV